MNAYDEKLLYLIGKRENCVARAAVIADTPANRAESFGPRTAYAFSSDMKAYDKNSPEDFDYPNAKLYVRASGSESWEEI